MEKLLTPLQARQEYLHFMAVPGQRYIGYLEWKKTMMIEVASTEFVKELIKLTGYPGHSELDDVYQWVADELWLVDQRINDMRNNLSLLISTNLSLTIAALVDAYSVMSNTINSVNILIGEVHQSILTVVSKTGDWIAAALEGAAYQITRAIEHAQEDTAFVALAIKDAIVMAFHSLTDSFAMMYDQFEVAIDRINSNLGFKFDGIGAVIIEAIRGAVDLAVTVVDSLAAVITAVVESTALVLTALVNGIVTTVDILVNGLREIIVGTINTLIDYMKWQWGETTSLLDKMFDFDIETLTPLFVRLVEAQQKAFAILKERSLTVQP